MGLLVVELVAVAVGRGRSALEADHRAAGIPLSGRVLHVCHYLPVQATLNRSHSTHEAPLTPPPEADSPVLEDKTDDVWTPVPCYGHAAMISGIRSLAPRHWLHRRHPCRPTRRAALLFHRVPAAALSAAADPE
ncbi:hypothetical protein B0H16DRAFT_1902891 [Mycena metata]|uniref:Uncharacterized protein n=1 Tax=Mycena metata TaxID=1033252 RepID=A0AAD7DY32_9AGAR|nr:hypothetical protein B0H16DRAFT_1902891 [Mycena metata]